MRDGLFVLGLGGHGAVVAFLSNHRMAVEKGGYRVHRGEYHLDNIVEPSEGGGGGRLGRHREWTWKVG
jgi:hypothetical protein